VLNLLSKLFPARSTRLCSELAGVDGYTGNGDIDYVAFPDGKHEIVLRINGVAGLKADLYINGAHICPIDISNGKGRYFYTSPSGAISKEEAIGAEIEVRQNGAPILLGALG